MKKKPVRKNSKPSQKKPSAISISVTKLSLQEVFHSQWFLPLTAAAILIIFFSIRMISNYDTGFHLAAGKWIIENAAVPKTDIFTYTVPGNEYIDIQWLYQVMIYIFYSISGYPALTLLNSFMILLVFYFMFRRMNIYGVGLHVSVILLLVTVLSIQVRFGYRPEIVTWLFILAMLYVLDRYFYFGERNLFLLPVIMILWVNMHGLFIIGMIIIVSYMVSIYVKHKIIDKTLLKWAGISTAVILINPYSSEGAFFPFYLFTRLQAGSIFRETITELNSPFSMLGKLDLEIILYLIIATTGFILIFITYRRRSLHEFILLAAFFYISFSSFRNVPIFIIYAVNIIAISASDLLKMNSRKFENMRKYKTQLSVAFTVIVFLIIVRVITGAYYYSYNSGIKFGTGADETILPVQTAEFINQNSIDGKIINKLEFGGWLDWTLKQKVFIDGRLEVIKEDFYKEYYTSFSANGLSGLINKYDPLLVINDIETYSWTEQMNKMSGWRLIHWDKAGAVYAKNGYAENVSIDFSSQLAACDIDTSNFTPEKINAILQSGRISGFGDWTKGFYKRRIKPIWLMKMGNFAFDNQQLKAAELLYLSFIERCEGAMDETNYSDVYYNLGAVYYLLKDPAHSLYCYEKYLQLKPYDTNIRNRVNEIKRMQ